MADLPTFGSYRTIRQLGSGGFADVCLVEDRLGRQYAIKQIKPKIIKQDPNKFRERFEREARIQARLEHPHIAPIHDYDNQQGYLVIKYANRGSLRELLDNNFRDGMDPRTALTILNPIGAALTYSHEKFDPSDQQRRGAIHLDVNPKNILVHDEDVGEGETRRRYLLTDFGLAHWISQTGEPDGGSSLQAGTRAYMAPEQLAPETFGNPSPKSDVFALGVTLREMLSGQPPRQLNRPISPEVVAVVQKATAQDPQRRYDSVRDLVTAFTQAVEGTDSHTRYAGLGPSPTPQVIYRSLRRSVWARLIAVMALLILIGGGLGWWKSPHSPLVPALHSLCLGTDFPVSGNDSAQGRPAENGADLAIAQHYNLGQGYTLEACNKDDVSRITGKADADLLYNNLGMSTTCVGDDQEDYGEELANTFSGEFQSYGGNTLNCRIHVSADETLAQLAESVRQVVALHPNVNAFFFGGVTSNGAGRLKAQLVRARFSGPFIGGDGIALDAQFLKDAGPVANNTYATLPGPDPLALSQSFSNAYQDRYGAQPTQRSANAYDAAMLLITAIQSVINQSAIKMNLLDLRSAVLKKVQHPDRPYHGVTGTITFDSNGDNTGTETFSVYAVESGQWIDKPEYMVTYSG